MEDGFGAENLEDPDETLVNDETGMGADSGSQDLDANDNKGRSHDDEGDEDYNHEDDEENDEDEGDQTCMPKAGWSEDTVQTEAMGQLGISVNTVARVIVCSACAFAVKPLDLPGHLSKTHSPISTSAAFSQELASTYDLRADLDSRPGSIITAIYGLDLLGGFQTCDTCGYACKSGKAMERHMKESEGCKTSRARPVQTFRPSSKRYYFGVNMDPEHAEESAEASLDPLVYLKKFIPIPFCNVPIKSANMAQDANHFLNLEKWDLYVQGRTGAEITHTVRGREPVFRDEVRTCVERFAADVAANLAKVDHEVKAAMADYIG